MHDHNNTIWQEIKEHIPFTLAASITAVAIVLIIKLLTTMQISEEAFEILHPLHVVVSALVTAGIFYKYKKNIFASILIGISGAILIGSISDVIFPYLGGTIMNLDTHFHLPILEEPIKILVAALVGSIIGIFGKITKIPHFIHVFLSVFASLFYLMAFSNTPSLIHIIISTIVVFIAVILPCCISDIIYPTLFLKRKA